MVYERKIPKEDYEKIKTLLEDGKTYQFIADIYGVSKQRIRQVAIRFGLQRYGIKIRKDSDFVQICKEKLQAKRNSIRQQGIVFSITFKDLDWPTYCPVLGLELNYYTEGGRQEESVSFDRFNPEVGYVPGNVYICSWRANRLKNNGTAEEHKKIYEFMLAMREVVVV